ncbi:unnamed protein product [Linum tenue]|uniref:CUE domain-containing protein n=1 Tax=Linum tenue TaxID=586396 RepID=A0AAV0QB50_9ROSI|nr:unnamed protein product [Linum tenue]
MSAIVCGKRSFFEELNVTSPPVNKRIRCSSSSPVRFSPPRPSPASSFSTPPRAPVVSSASAHLVEQLAAIFPEMDKELLERALAECGEDLDSAIRSLNELRLGSADKNLDSDGGKCDGLLDANGNVQGVESTNPALPPAEDPSFPSNVQMDGAEWVELFVREMTSASNMDDAKARASRALEALEKSIYARAGAEAVKNFQLENLKLKEQVQLLIHENTILKRAVTIQHERQKEFDDRNQELQHLKQLVAQYQDQLRTLEVNNYALTMHLKQAQQSSSIPGRFHPDVF